MNYGPAGRRPAQRTPQRGRGPESPRPRGRFQPRAAGIQTGRRVAPVDGELVATTFLGLEEALAGELRALGARNIRPRRRAVAFAGDTRMMYTANLHLRTALRVVQPVATFQAGEQQALYEGIGGIDWSQYIGIENTIAVESALATPLFTHSQYVALLTKDAIVDQFRAATGKRPSVNVLSPDLRVHVYIHNDSVTVSLDSSGDSLHRRGYRLDKTEAPLNEATAASLVRYTGWSGESAFADPMCGSGTIAIEAAMIASGRAPGLCGRPFGFMRWRGFDTSLWDELLREARSAQREPAHAVVASDSDPRALTAARDNANRAGVASFIDFRACRFEESRAPASQGCLVVNPPYGERLSASNLGQLYHSLGLSLRDSYRGWNAWILSSNSSALEQIELSIAQERTVYNGKIECCFREYRVG